MNITNILTIISTASDLQDAIAQLQRAGLNPTRKKCQFSDDIYCLPMLNFWEFKGNLYVNVFSYPLCQLASKALKFFAQQQDLTPEVPAFVSSVAGQSIPKQSTESVDNINWREPADRLDFVKSHPKINFNIEQIRVILRTGGAL